MLNITTITVQGLLYPTYNLFYFFLFKCFIFAVEEVKVQTTSKAMKLGNKAVCHLKDMRQNAYFQIVIGTTTD